MKKLLYFLCLMFSMVFVFAGCSNKGDDVQVTEADELIQMLNKDIPAIQGQELSAMDTYNSYFTEGTTIDKDAFLSDLNDSIIPEYEEFMTNLTALSYETEQVQECYQLYYSSMEAQHQALLKVQLALTEENEDYQSEAAGYLETAKTDYESYKEKVSQVAAENNILINGIDE